MSDIIEGAVKALNERLAGEGIDGAIKFEIEGEGTVRVDENGASADDGPADCTMFASSDTFREIMDGELNPTNAFMSGRLRIEGDMGLAMKLGSLLA